MAHDAGQVCFKVKQSVFFANGVRSYYIRAIMKHPFEVDLTKTDQLEKSFEGVTNKIQNFGMSPKEAFGVSPSFLEHAYAQAYRFYNTGKYGEAIHLFRLLVMFNAMEPKYMMGLAACHHMMKEFPSAIQTYTLCSVMDPGNPIPHYHSSDCYTHLKEPLAALLSLELAIQACGDKPAHAKLKERAILSRDSLKELVKSTPLNPEPDSMRAFNQNPIASFLDDAP